MFTDANGKKWYKGNLHTHTTVSDGRKTPEEAIALYRENGYDFLSLTDHWQVSSGGIADNGMLLLPGCEYNVNGADVIRGVFHIVAIGMKEPAALDKKDPALGAQAVIDAVHNAGGIAILAHPAWSLDTCEQIMALNGFDGVEIYNSVSGLPRNCRPYSGEVIDQLAARGIVYPCMAADDSHFYENEACLSCIYVQADALTEEAVMEALRAGRVIATQGPRLSVTEEPAENASERKIRVRCDPVQTIIFYTGSVWIGQRSISADSKTGELLTEAEFTLRQNDRFVRVECIDSDGMHGYATPILY
ncbi:MAG: CehA/McbA family metallohydrolase [Eubacteriales bacterium]